MIRGYGPALGLVVAAALCAGCGPAGARPGRTRPTVTRIERASQLLGGPGASGRLGDIRLDNGVIAAVIDKLGTGQGNAESGGNLVDLAPAGGQDFIWQVFTYFADNYPRQAIYDGITTSSTATEAIVRVRGRDSNDPAIRVETSYVLREGARVLIIRSTIENLGKTPMLKFGVGDVIQWGHAQRFLPGRAEPAKGSLQVAWGAGVGERSSYVYGAPSGELSGIHGSAWSDFIVATPDVPPGAKVTIERFIAVGTRPDVASALEPASALLPAMVTSVIEGAVVEAGSDRPAPATVSVLRDGVPVTTVATGSDGRFATELPFRSYTVTTLGRERTAAPPVLVKVAGGENAAKLRLTVSPPGALTATLTSAGAPSAGKVTLEGIEGTPNPHLGPEYAAGGAHNIAVTHEGRLRLVLAPGRYRATCSRGIEFDVDVHELTVPAGSPARLTCDLRRAVETPGRMAFDLHQHAVPSSDAAVSLADRVIADLAEGLEGFAGTDHNTITDYAETVRQLGVGQRIVAITGNEATAENLGHFNAYPLVADPKLERFGAPPVSGRSAGEIFAALRGLAPADKIIQVNHPRAGRSGYFDRIAFDPTRPGFPGGWSADFDALEIVNGKRLKELDAALQDWLELLRRGKTVTAVGNSDTHAIHGTEAGYPRNMIGVPNDDPGAVTAADVVAAIRRGDVVVTNGPLLTVGVGRAGPGGTAPAEPRGRAAVRVRVEAAPWVDVDRVEVLVNAHPAGKPEVVASSRKTVRFEKTLTVAAPPGSFIVVIARGSRPLHPVVPTDGKPTTPIAIANPIWIAK